MQIRALLAAGALALVLSGCATTGNNAQQHQTERAQQGQVDIGYAHFQRGRYQEAKAAFGRALQIDPNSAGAHHGMARIYEVELDYLRAEESYKKSLRAEPSTRVYHSFGAFYYNRGQYAESYRQLAKAAEDDFYESRAAVFQAMGYSALKQDKLDDAVFNFSRAKALDSQMWPSVYSIAEIEFNRGNIGAAMKEVKELDRLDRANLVKANPRTLWLQIRVAHAANDFGLRDAWRIRLKREFARSPEATLLKEWETQNNLS